MNKFTLFCAISMITAIAASNVALPAKAADETVTVMARLYATPGREAEVEARLLKTLEFVRKAEPNITYRYYRSKKDPTLFVTYEVYPNQAAAGEHMKTVLPAFRKEAGVAPEGLFAKPMEVEILQEM